MKTLIQAAALLLLAGEPAFAQDAVAAPDTMTCGEFLALDADGQLQAMLALRASYNGESAPDAAAAGDAAGATQATGATAETSGDADASTADPDAGMAAEDSAATGEPVAAESKADPKLTAMRTSCNDVPDALAIDALVAAHADYE